MDKRRNILDWIQLPWNIGVFALKNKGKALHSLKVLNNFRCKERMKTIPFRIVKSIIEWKVKLHG